MKNYSFLLLQKIAWIQEVWLISKNPNTYKLPNVGSQLPATEIGVRDAFNIILK